LRTRLAVRDDEEMPTRPRFLIESASRARWSSGNASLSAASSLWRFLDRHDITFEKMDLERVRLVAPDRSTSALLRPAETLPKLVGNHRVHPTDLGGREFLSPVDPRSG